MGDVLADHASLPGAPVPLLAAATNATGTRLALGGPGGVAVYDGGCGAPLWSPAPAGTFRLADGAAATQLAWAHPDCGQALAVTASDGTLSIWQERRRGRGWERAEAAAAWRVPGGAGPRPPPLAWAPPGLGPRLAVGGGDGAVRVYVGTALLDAPSWELESEFVVGSGGSAVTALAWRADGCDDGSGGGLLPALLAVGTAGGAAAVWAHRPSLGDWAACVPDLAGAAASSPVTALAWAPRLGRPSELVAVATPSTVSLVALAGPADGPTPTRVATLSPPGVSGGGGTASADVSTSTGGGGVWAVEFDAFGTWLAASVSGRVVSEEEGGAAAAAAAAATAPPPPPRVCLWRPTLAGEWQLQGEVVAGPAG